jgi:hypothetical protein
LNLRRLDAKKKQIHVPAGNENPGIYFRTHQFTEIPWLVIIIIIKLSSSSLLLLLSSLSLEQITGLESGNSYELERKLSKANELDIKLHQDVHQVSYPRHLSHDSDLRYWPV